MAKLKEIYKCELCGNIVEIVHGGAGSLVCCGEAMKLIGENSTDAATEKHVPVIEKIDGGYKVSVGSTLHPMDEKHYIEWIEIQFDSKVGRKYLKPGEAPAAIFNGVDAANVTARAYCNLHGLWKAVYGE